MKIGILALQGDFDKHTVILNNIGLDSILVRYPTELNGIEGLIIPGGESTTLTHLMKRMNFYNPIIHFSKKYPILGTCAGLIMMAKRVNHPLVKPLGLLNMDVDRNAYGRQIHSFAESLPVRISNHIEKVPATFIRAPQITRIGDEVETLAEYQGNICGVKKGKHIALAFHPELDGVSLFHRVAFIPSMSINKEKQHAA